MANQFHTIDRGEFRLYCAPEQRAQGEWLADLVEGMRPRVGSTVQVGWSILKLVPSANGAVLCEPNFMGDPFNEFQPSVEITLRVLAEQRALLERAGCDPLPWRFDEKVVLRRGALEATRIYAERQIPKEGDSGWYVGIANDQSVIPTVEDMEALWAYQLLERRPELLAAFALPIGWMTVWDGRALEALVDEKNVAH